MLKQNAFSSPFNKKPFQGILSKTMAYFNICGDDPYLKKAEKAFEEANSFPILTKARLNQGHAGTSSCSMVVSSIWNQVSVKAAKKMTFAKTYSLDEKNLSTLNESYPIPNASEELAAFTKTFKAVINKSKNDKGDDQFTLDIFDQGSLKKSVNLSDFDLHGMVYFDQELGGIAINEDETKIAYIAEEKKPKTVPFFKSQKSEGENKTVVGQEFCYREEWGEQMVGKANPVIAVYDLNTEELNIWSGIADGYSPGQLVWYKSDLYGIAVSNTPKKLGLVYCTNRKSHIFKLTEAGDHTIVTSKPDEAEYTSVKCPRIHHQSGKMIYYQRQLNKKIFPGPHSGTYKLMLIDLNNENASPETILDIVQLPEADGFGGLCGYDYLPQRCFSEDGRIIVASVPVNDDVFPILIDLQEKKHSIMTKGANVTVLDVDKDFILGLHATFLEPPSLKIAKRNDQKADIDFIPIGTSAKPESLSGMVQVTFSNPTPYSDPRPEFAGVGYSYIYVGPENGDAKSTPMIVLPHGGPHGIVTKSFASTIYFFLKLGYALCIPNYRGSIGRGEKGIQSLLGMVGTLDVQDCNDARKLCLEKYAHLNPDQVALFGGSHGGFLVTHLAGQFPDEYHAVVSRNGVHNIASMAGITDIPDWTFNEAGLKYEFQPSTGKELQAMYDKSPIKYVKDIKCPIHINLGKDDLRVPASQSYEYYHALKANGKQVTMSVYEDNHPLGKPQTNINVMMNTAMFFHEVLKHD